MSKTKRPNVIVLFSDTFRYDYLGCNGNPWIDTQDLDRFARRAICFDNFYLSSFPTIPNRTDLFTGRASFGFHGWQGLDRRLPTISTIFGAAGYTTQLITDTPHLMSTEHYFHRGFTAAYQVRGQEGDVPLTKGKLPPRQVVPSDKRTRVDDWMGSEKRARHGNLANMHCWTNRDWAWEEDRFCAQTARITSRWLEENADDAPFLLWVDFFDPHEPWDPPEYLVRRYDRSGYDGPPMIHPNYGPADIYTKQELANLAAHYAAEAYLTNRWIGHVLRKIEDLELFDNSIVIFASDHGMFLGEHNRTGKSNIHPDDDRIWPLYEELAHVPLIVSAPGLDGGRRVKQFVQSFDLLPTLMDLCGVKGPTREMHGESFATLLRGQARPWKRRAAFSSHFIGHCGPTVTNARWSYVSYGEKDGRPELYDRVADPKQQRNLIRKHPQAAKTMHQTLMRFLKRIGAPDENHKIWDPVTNPDYGKRGRPA